MTMTATLATRPWADFSEDEDEDCVQAHDQQDAKPRPPHTASSHVQLQQAHAHMQRQHAQRRQRRQQQQQARAQPRGDIADTGDEAAAMARRVAQIEIATAGRYAALASSSPPKPSWYSDSGEDD